MVFMNTITIFMRRYFNKTILSFANITRNYFFSFRIVKNRKN